MSSSAESLHADLRARFDSIDLIAIGFVSLRDVKFSTQSATRPSVRSPWFTHRPPIVSIFLSEVRLAVVRVVSRWVVKACG